MKTFVVDVDCTVEVEAEDEQDALRRVHYYDGLQRLAERTGKGWHAVSAREKGKQ